MHPEIVAFSNARYYQGKLKTKYYSDYTGKPIEIININGNGKIVLAILIN